MTKLTDQEKRDLQAIADLGFLYMQALNAIPDHISIAYKDYFKHRGARHYTKHLVSEFTQVTLAIIKGYSPQQREEHLKLKARPGCRSSTG